MNDKKDGHESAKYPRKFENIDGYTSRLRVPDGWLVVYTNRGAGASMLFLSDPEHKWEL